MRSKLQPPKILLPRLCHGLSNGAINQWNKVYLGRSNFEKEVQFAEQEVKFAGPNEVPKFMKAFSNALLTVMLNEKRQKGNNVQLTDEPFVVESALSSIFVNNFVNNHATVSTTILIVHKSGQCRIDEYSYSHRNQYLMWFFSKCVKRWWINRHSSYEFQLDVTKVQEPSRQQPTNDSDGPIDES